MKRTIAWIGIMAACLLCVACGSDPVRPHPWNQSYSDGSNSGFNAVRTGDATASTKKWSAPVGPLIFSYPVVGSDGTVYVGNAAGQAVAVNPDGSVRWRYLMGETIVAAPVVDPSSGEVFFVVQNPLTPTDFGSFIYRLSPSGTILAVSTETFATTGAPKIWRNYVFVVGNGELYDGWLYVFDRVSLRLVAKAWASQCFNLVCAGVDPFGWLWSAAHIFNCMITGWPSDCFDPLAYVGPLHGGSVAILDGPAIVEDANQPLLVVTSQQCASAWRFNPAAAPDQRLQSAWDLLLVHMDCGFKKVRTTSPAVFAGGQVVFADEKGRVLSLDAKTGGQLWAHELDFPVQAPPVAFLRQIYVVTYDRLVVLDSDGATVSETPLRGVGSMAALSWNRVYVSTTEGIHSFTLDPGQGATFESLTTGVNVAMRSGLAIGQDGTVYVSTPDGFLHAYGAR